MFHEHWDEGFHIINLFKNVENFVKHLFVEENSHKIYRIFYQYILKNIQTILSFCVEFPQNQNEDVPAV